MKTILRNLFYTLKRFRTPSVLNLLGLSTAFAAFILIMMKVSYEYNFDTCYPDSDRIAVLNLSVDHHPNELIVLPRPFVEGVIEETPAIECGAFFDCSPNYAELISTDAKQPQYIYEPITVVSPDFARTLGMAFITGNDEGLRQPGGAIISESQARKLFPKGNAVGSYLYMPENKKLLITGVYKDFPENSQFKNVIYRDIDKQKNKDRWGTQSYYAIIRMKPGINIQTLNEQLKSSHLAENMTIYSESDREVCAMPIRNVYYEANPWIFYKVGDRQHTWLLITIAILTISIAAINLINFSTALTPMRIRSINTQKVLGSPCQPTPHRTNIRNYRHRPYRMVTFTIYRVDSNTHETTQSDRIYAFLFYLSTCNSDIRRHCFAYRYNSRSIPCMVYDFISSGSDAER